MSAAKPRKGGRPPGAARYKRIAELIEAEIAAGQHAVGSALPTEAALGQHFDCGRHTVRDALRLLAQAGLIERRAGSGSTVLRQSRSQGYVHAITGFDQWFVYPQGVSRRRLHQGAVTADAALAAALGCEAGSAWFCISALRSVAAPASAASATPLCWVDIYLQRRFAGVVSSPQIDERPVHEQIEAMFGVAIAEVEARIFAGPVPAHMAEALQTPAGSAALWLQRRYLSAAGELLQATQTVHPENRYVYAMKFQRAAGGSRGGPVHGAVP